MTTAKYKSCGTYKTFETLSNAKGLQDCLFLNKVSHFQASTSAKLFLLHLELASKSFHQIHHAIVFFTSRNRTCATIAGECSLKASISCRCCSAAEAEAFCA